MSLPEIKRAYMNGEFVFPEGINLRTKTMHLLIQIKERWPKFNTNFDYLTWIVYEMTNKPRTNRVVSNPKKYQNRFLDELVNTWIKSHRFKKDLLERMGEYLIYDGRAETARLAVDKTDAFEHVARHRIRRMMSTNVSGAEFLQGFNIEELDPNVLTERDREELKMLPVLLAPFKPLLQASKEHTRLLLAGGSSPSGDDAGDDAGDDEKDEE